MDKSQRVAVFMKEAPDIVKNNNKLVNFIINDGFLDMPASTKYHGAYEGGLFDHSAMVYLELKRLTEGLSLKWQRPESVFIVGMFHDLCKYDQYVRVDGEEMAVGDNMTITTHVGHHYEYNKDTLLKGHGAKSVMLLSQFLPLTEEEILCIRYHMGPYETDEWSEFDKSIRKYQNVYFAHAADMIASKVDDV